MSESSKRSTAPKPVHSGQLPYGLLKENSCGVGVRNSISGWSGQRNRSVKRIARLPHGDDDGLALAFRERRLQRIRQARRVLRVRREPVDDHQQLARPS